MPINPTISVPGEQVILNGTDRLTSWQLEGKGVWRVDIPNEFFGTFNPFTISYSSAQPDKHLGTIYLNNHPLIEESSHENISTRPLSWYTSQTNGITRIWAHFGPNNPNKQVTEVTMRRLAFGSLTAGINFITFDGFQVTQIASPQAVMDGEQSGAISTGGERIGLFKTVN